MTGTPTATPADGATAASASGETPAGGVAARPIPPRLFRVTYVSERSQPRRGLAFVKCPYGGIHDLYALTAALTRAVNTRQIRWFRVDVPRVITPEMRAAVKRWPEALALSSQRTGVTWE